jgi:hypothetical protein
MIALGELRLPSYPDPALLLNVDTETIAPLLSMEATVLIRYVCERCGYVETEAITLDRLSVESLEDGPEWFEAGVWPAACGCYAPGSASLAGPPVLTSPF